MHSKDDDDINGWHLELEDRWTASALRHVDKSLCGEVQVGIDDDGRFFMRWKEQHPELGTWEDFFGDNERTAERIDSSEWQDMLERLPSSEHEVELSQAEAYELFVRALLPAQLHGLAGLIDL
jgi:hypothetical protein